MRSKNIASVKSSVKSEAPLLSTEKNDAGEVLIARLLFRLAKFVATIPAQSLSQLRYHPPLYR
jgi:hypothetical protein